VVLKRHKVEKGPGAGHVCQADFTVGSTITLYGRTIFLTDCDNFTAEW
jgi:hypothetical protein